MADVLALVGNAIDTVKKLKAIEDKIANAELRNLIGDLSLALADLKIQAAELKNENLHLKTELARKKSHEDHASQLIPKDGVLYFKEQPTDKPIGPYCPNCKQNQNRLVLLEDKRGTAFAQMMSFRCPECHAHLH